MAFRFSTLALAAALALPLSATAAVEPMQTFSADYSVSFLGIPVARSTFVSRIGSTRYTIDGSVESLGLGTFFEKTTAKATVSGRVDKGRMTPLEYSVDYVYGKKAKKTSLRFAKGKVVEVSNQPPLPRREDWVPVDPGELVAVLDPITATIVRAKDIRSVCDHTAKAFDGALRADMSLSFVGTAPASLDGYESETVTCTGRFKPIAGYRRGNKSLRYLSTQSEIVVTFAELGKTGLYAPVQASVGTRIGTVSIHARRLVAKE